MRLSFRAHVAALIFAGTISTARSFLVAPLASRQSIGCRTIAGRQHQISPALTSLKMNKALQRPGEANSDAKTVALIGGGIAGLACARRLKELGLAPTVFDTGKHAVGGRVSSRVLSFEDKTTKKTVSTKVDHSTQFFTATDDRFRQLVGWLEAQGAVKEWKGPVGILENGSFSALDDSEEKRWVGRGGIDAVPKALAQDLRTIVDCWVAVVERQDNGKWRLFKVARPVPARSLAIDVQD